MLKTVAGMSLIVIPIITALLITAGIEILENR